MDKQKFAEVLAETVGKSKELLGVKGEQYAETEDDSDRLIQFRMAASLRQTSEEDALAGMMVKHTTKLYFMLSQFCCGDKDFSLAEWDEVVIDHINYLILLRALLSENTGREKSL